jgi:hypothetical protein
MAAGEELRAMQREQKNGDRMPPFFFFFLTLFLVNL